VERPCHEKDERDRDCLLHPPRGHLKVEAQTRGGCINVTSIIGVGTVPAPATITVTGPVPAPAGAILISLRPPCNEVVAALADGANVLVKLRNPSGFALTPVSTLDATHAATTFKIVSLQSPTNAAPAAAAPPDAACVPALAAAAGISGAAPEEPPAARGRAPEVVEAATFPPAGAAQPRYIRTTIRPTIRVGPSAPTPARAPARTP